MHRYCHGNDAGDGVAGCIFDWPDKDDWKYFLVAGVKLTAKDYAASEAKIRSMIVEGCSFPKSQNR